MTSPNSQRAHDAWQRSAPKPPAQSDAEFRAQVRADAIKAGCSPDVADMLARDVGRERTDNEIAAMPSRVRDFFGFRMHASARHEPRDALTRMCEMFGAESLVGELRASGRPLHDVAAMLTAATGSARAISESGKGNVRMQLLARNHWSN